MSAHGTLNGNITDTGGENCDFRGFVWDTISRGDPGDVAPGASAYANNWTEGGSFGTGAFSHQVTGLAEDDTFYVRACAHNSAGWSYGGEVSFNTPEAHVKSLSDTVAVGDSIVLASEYYRSFADAVGLADAISKQPGLIEADIIAIADAISKEFGLAKADTLGITDAIEPLLILILVLADNIAIADDIVKEIGVNKADSISISDSISDIVEFFLSIGDTITLGDAISKKPGLFKADTIAISDAVVAGVEYLLSISDSIALADAISKQPGLVKSDIISMADSIVTALAINFIFSDIITIADQARLGYPIRAAVIIARLAAARLPSKHIHEEDV